MRPTTDELIQRARARVRTDARRPYVSAYFYSFYLTGDQDVDDLLAVLAMAGKTYHSTEMWNDGYSDDDPDFIQAMQDIAVLIASRWRDVNSPEDAA